MGTPGEEVCSETLMIACKDIVEEEKRKAFSKPRDLFEVGRISELAPSRRLHLPLRA